MTMHRIARIFILDRRAFTEFDEADSDALEEAMVVVSLVAFSGELMGILNAAFDWVQKLSVLRIIFFTFWAFAGWFIWSIFVFVIGAGLFGGKASFKQALQWIGLAQAPLMLQAIPVYGPIVGNVWALVAAFVAIRNGMQLNVWKTLVTIAIGWVAVWFWSTVLGYLLEMSAPYFNLPYNL